MQIEYRSASIFNVNADAWVNPVNCIGISGSGLAFKFKKAFPENYEVYRKACVQGHMAPGMLLVTVNENPLSVEIGYPKYIVNVATKNHWKNPSRIAYVTHGMTNIMQWVFDNKIESIAIPMLGCGLGGLDWEKEVKPIFDSSFKQFDDADCHVSVLI